jgi:uncharacterized lipoprotein YmbA
MTAGGRLMTAGGRPMIRRVMLALLLSGCASAPAERFYTLTPGARVPLGGDGRSVVVGQALLPELVDRPQLVRRGDANRVVILEQQRWAEPLRTGVPRVVAENLRTLLGSPQISTRDEVIGPADCRVELDIRRLDADSTRVSLDALWTVACTGTPKRPGHSSLREPITDTQPPSLVAAQSRALDHLSHDIALAFRALPKSAPPPPNTP